MKIKSVFLRGVICLMVVVSACFSFDFGLKVEALTWISDGRIYFVDERDFDGAFNYQHIMSFNPVLDIDVGLLEGSNNDQASNVERQRLDLLNLTEVNAGAGVQLGDNFPSPSPNGRQVAFSRYAAINGWAGGGNGNLCIMDSDGTDAVNVVTQAACGTGDSGVDRRTPFWHTDGYIYYGREVGADDMDLYRVNVESGVESQVLDSSAAGLSGSTEDIVFTRSSNYIFFQSISATTLYRATFNGSIADNVVDFSALSNGVDGTFDQDATASPIEDIIAFRSTRDVFNGDIYISNYDGEDPYNPGEDPIRLTTNALASNPWFSPDGTRLVYQETGGGFYSIYRGVDGIWGNGDDTTTHIADNNKYYGGWNAGLGSGVAPFIFTLPTFARWGSMPDYTAPEISGVGTENLAATSVDITVTTDESATCTVAYGLDGGALSSSEAEGSADTGARSIGLSGLSDGTAYDYRVTCVDASENSAQSGLGGFTTLDATAPEISGVGTENLAATSVDITVTTDESATCTVAYGLDGGALSSSEAEGSADTGARSIGLSGLSDGTAYDYRVTCVDASENSAQSELGGFTTLDATAPEISGVGTENLAATSVDITVTTDESATCTVAYGLDGGALSSSEAEGSADTGARSIGLSGLSDGTAYDYRVTCVDASENSAQSELGGFTTLDATAPEISGVGTENLAATSVDITVTTDESATCTVAYGLDGGALSSSEAEGSADTGARSIGLSGLSDGTAYDYRVTCVDASENSAQSELGGFTTLDATAPEISGVGTENLAATSVDITVTTDESATCTVAYGLDGGALSSSEAEGSADTGARSIGLSGLSDGTAYDYRVTCVDASENSAQSELGGFTTIGGAVVTGGGGGGNFSFLTGIVTQSQQDLVIEGAVVSEFDENSTGEYFNESLKSAISLGLLSEKQKVFPAAFVSRCSVAKLVTEVVGVDIIDTFDPIFLDVEADNFYAKYVYTGVELGWWEGRNDGSKVFDCSIAMTRAELAAVVSRIKGYTVVDENGYTPEDDYPQWSLAFIRRVNNAGIMLGLNSKDGKSSPIFGANNSLTQAELFTVFDRAQLLQ